MVQILEDLTLEQARLVTTSLMCFIKKKSKDAGETDNIISMVTYAEEIIKAKEMLDLFEDYCDKKIEDPLYKAFVECKTACSVASDIPRSK